MQRKKKLKIAIKRIIQLYQFYIKYSLARKGKVGLHPTDQHGARAKRTGQRAISVSSLWQCTLLEILLVWLTTASITPIKDSIQSGEHFQFENLAFERTNDLDAHPQPLRIYSYYYFNFSTRSIHSIHVFTQSYLHSYKLYNAYITI